MLYVDGQGIVGGVGIYISIGVGPKIFTILFRTILHKYILEILICWVVLSFRYIE